MPDMSGRQLADRALGKRPNLKVLYTTGYTRNAIVHNGMLDPGTNLLTKPFSIEELATKIRKILDDRTQKGVCEALRQSSPIQALRSGGDLR